MTEEDAAALLEAARSGDHDRVWAVLDEGGTRVNTRGDYGTSALHVAAERDDLELALGLLDRGGDPTLTADWGQTPFEYAANMNSRRVADMLLERGAGTLDMWTAAALGRLDDVARYFEGGSPPPGSGRRPVDGAAPDHWPAETAFRSGDEVSDAFYIACRNGNRAVAEFLMTQGADIEARGYFGATALHWAAGQGRLETVEWLIEEGADPSLRDPRFDGTAAGWAREFGHEDVARRIEEIGGGA